MSDSERNSIAVIGMSCRLPGARNVDEFWTLLKSGRDALTELADSELAKEGVERRWLSDPTYVKAAMLLDDIEGFDADFFGIPAPEATMMDPQQRLLLECAWEALESSCQLVREGDARVGVWVGARLSEYMLHFGLVPDLFGHGGESPVEGFRRLLVNDKDYLATRIAYLLDLRGPAITVQTACSTSAVAVHSACQSLLNGECEVALAGGASVRVPQRVGYIWSDGMIYSRDGRTRPFDADGGGTIFGSGAGMVALKRLSDARADGDPIHAVIRGSAVNNDGAGPKAAFTAPSFNGQVAVIAEAQAVAGVEGREISYVEAHGTGTAAGDPIEVSALTEAFRASGATPGSCSLGSVKSNVGHLIQASGVASLIKTCLMLEHRSLVPNVNFSEPNPLINFDETPFVVSTETKPWKHDGPLRAGISSFGFGGTNAHLIVEEAPVHQPTSVAEPRILVLPLSAKSPEAVNELAARYSEHLKDEPAPIGETCFSAQMDRIHFAHRLSASGSSPEELIESLDSLRKSSPVVSANDGARVAFLFTGQGSQFPGMGKTLYENEPTFRRIIEECDGYLRSELDRPLKEIFFGDDSEALLERTDLVQPAMVSFGAALTTLWREWGIEPDVTLGHSLGELTAAWAAGIYSLRDIVRFAAIRGRLMHRGRSLGSMVTVFAAAEEVVALIESSRKEISVAAINGPEQTVVSGATGAITDFVAHLEADSIHSRRLNVDYAFHSPLMDDVLPDLEKAAEALSAAPPKARFVTTLTGQILDGPENWAEHWRRQCREPVRFRDAVAAAASECQILLEIGCDSVLTSIARASTSSPTLLISSLKKGRSDLLQLSEAVGALYAGGATPDWKVLAGESDRRRKRQLPTYPFQRKRYWIERRSEQRAVASSEPILHPLLGRRIFSPLPEKQFESQIDVNVSPYAQDHWIYGMRPLIGVAHMEMMRAAASDALQLEGSIALENVVIETPILLDDLTHHLHTVVDTRPDGGEVRIYGRAESTAGEWVLHSSAQLRIVREQPEHIDLDEIRKRSLREIAPDELINAKTEKGAALGPAIENIRRAWQGDGEILVETSVGPEAADFEAYGAYPALLNAGPHCAEFTLDPSVPRTDLFLPTVMERITFHGPLPRRIFAWLELREASREVYGVDCRLMDESGLTLVKMNGLFLKRATPHTLRRVLESSTGVSYEPVWTKIDRQPQAPETPNGRWLVFSDESGLTEPVAKEIGQLQGSAVEARAGDRFERVGPHSFIVDPTKKQHLADLLRDVSSGEEEMEGIVYGWGLDATGIEQGSERTVAALYLAQVIVELGLERTTLVVLTRGAQATGLETGPLHPEQSTLWGFVRTLRREHSSLQCKLVDLDPGASSHPEEMVRKWLSHEEEEIAVRGHDLLGLRIERLSAVRHHAAPGRLVRGSETTIEGLSTRAMQRTDPQPGQIEIEVRATGLNFRDVLNATGRLEGSLGYECAGIVAACGEGLTDLSVGDRVMALASDSMASHVLADSRLACRIPDSLNFAQSAGTLLAFVTAYYGLVSCARLSSGERVLVHTASGGVGQAATEIIRALGAEVYATASEGKWAYLRSRGVDRIWSSREPGFSKDLLVSAGRGVDVVINTLGEAFFDDNFALLKPGGRWIELGHPGVLDIETLRKEAEAKGIAFFNFHTAQVAATEPDTIGAIIATLRDWFDEGRIQPVPHRSFSITKPQQAFETMLRGAHVGKLVLVQPQKDDPGFVIRDDATYLITGGTGAVGLQSVRWLADQGARSIALIGRRPPSDQAKAIIDGLTESGVSIRWVPGDVADRTSLDRALAEIHQEMAPLRGLIHAAGITDDGSIPQLDRSRFESVLAPKLAGGWNLHQATLTTRLDFFILISSVAGLWGNAGQANYAAANAFLDQLAHYRRQLGLPSLAIDFGLWKGEGMGAALSDAVRRRREESGLGALDPETALEEMFRAIAEDRSQIVATVVDWPRFAGRFEDLPAIFSSLSIPARRTERHPVASPSSDRTGAPPRSLEDAIERIRSHVSPFASGAIDDSDLTRPLPELGLDSLTSLLVRGRLADEFGPAGAIPVVRFLEGRSIAGLAEIITESARSVTPPPRRSSRPTLHLAPPREEAAKTLVALNDAGPRPPFLLIPPAGMTMERFSGLAKYVDSDQPFFGFNPVGFDGEMEPHDDVPTMAQYYLDEMREHRSGPVVVGGICFGSWVALEMALRLTESWQDVRLLIVVDDEPPRLGWRERSPLSVLTYYWDRLRFLLSHRSLQRSLADRFRRARRQSGRGEERSRGRYPREYAGDTEAVERAHRVLAAHAKAAESYRTRRFDGDIAVILGRKRSISHNEGIIRKWKNVSRGSVKGVIVETESHRSILDPENAEVLGSALADLLRQVK